MLSQGNVLVTGSRGILGSHLKKELTKQGHTVIGTRRPGQLEIDGLELEIAPYKIIDIENLQIDFVIHLAGEYRVQTDQESIKTVTDSIVGLSSAICQLVRENAVPVIACGSFFERSPVHLSPWSYYSQAKEMSHQLLKEAVIEAGTSLDYVYLYDNYGGESTRGKFLDLVLNESKIYQPVKASGGMQVQDLTHISDIVQGIALLLQRILSPRLETCEWQIRSRQVLNLRELEELARKFHLSKNRFLWGELPYRLKEVFEIWDSAADIPGWSPTWTLEKYFQELTLHKKGDRE